MIRILGLALYRASEQGSGLRCRASCWEPVGICIYTYIHIFMGFHKGTFLGVLTIRIIVFGGLSWGPLILGNYHTHMD